jgi:hypothetical protein
MRPEAAAARLRDAVNASPLIGTSSGQLAVCHYPMPAQLNGQYPALVLFVLGGPVAYAGEQYWTYRIKGQVLVGALNDPPAAFLRVESLIAPLVDLFAPGTDAYHLPSASADGVADFCRVGDWTASQAIAYGAPEPNHWGGEVFWDLKVRRFTGDA